MSTGFNRSHILIIVLAVIILPRLSVKVLVLTPIVIVGVTVGWVLLDLSLTGWSHKLTIENDEAGTSSEPRWRRRRRLVAPLIFTSAAAWSVIQTRSIWEGTSTSNSTTFPSAPPQLNASLSTLFSHIIKHFVLKWYSAISTSPTFPNAVDQTMKESLVNIVDRVDKIDWSDLIVGRVLPLITEHVESFRPAEYALRGQDLQTPLTESDELDLFLAARYAVQSKLHPAVDVTSPQSKSSEEAWLSELMGKLLPLVMPEREVESRAVLIMTREIIACAVMFPIVDLLSDPDFWNRLIEQKAGAAIRDQRMVTQFREALDKQGSALTSTSLTKSARSPSRKTDEISATTSNKSFESFVRGIGKCSNLLDARRLRSDVTGQITKNKLLVVDCRKQDPVDHQRLTRLTDHIERLNGAKRKADKRIADLGGTISSNRDSISTDSAIAPRIKLRDILLSSTSLSYFMEYQDRRRRSLPVQFWLLIESLKDPLEDVDSSSDDDMTDRVRRPDIATVTTTLSDIKMVWDVYFATSNELESNRRYIRTIKDFVETEEVSSITSGKIRRVRRAIFAAQADVLEGMEEEDYPGFVKTELYFKAVSALSLQQQPGPISSDTGAPNFSLPETRARSPSLEIIPTPPVRSAAQFPFSLSRATSPRPSPSSTSLPSLAIRVDHPPSRDHENKSLLSPRFVSDPIVASPAMVRTISTGSIELGLGIVVPPNKRRPINPLSNSLEFLMASTSPVTSSKVEKKEKRVPLFEEPLFGEDDDDTNGKEESGEEEFGRKQDERVELSDDEYVQVKSIEAIQDALSSILASDARMASSHTTATLPSRSASPGVTTRSFTDIQRSRTNKPMTSVLTASTTSTTATLDSTKDVKFGKNKRVIFDDGEEFDEEEEFASKVDTEFDLDILVAAPGDLHLPLEIANIAERIDKLEHQESVVAALIRKAILTGVASELKILGKSQDSLKREVRTLTFQKAQYESQESENKLVPGRTNVSISGTTVGQANNQSFQLYLVELHQLAADGTFTSGWIVTRRYSEFATLHGKLKEKYNTAAKAIDLPGKSIVDRYTDNFIKQRKLGLEKYLKALVKIPILCESNELRSFLSQQNISLPRLDEVDAKKSNTGQGIIRSFYRSVTSGIDDLFTGSSSSSMMDTIIQRLSQQVDDISSVNSNEIVQDDDLVNKVVASATPGVKEGLTYFTGPICDLFVTLFELKDKNNWLRRQAILIILQQVLGGTIERKFRDAVKIALAPEQIITYLQLFQDTLFPLGELKPPSPARTVIERAETKDSANAALVALMPVIGASMIGRSNAKQGARRIFAVLQNRRLNRHLIYSMIDEVISALFPELK